jgi:hypothetical protein
MNALTGLALAIAALAVGFAVYGWPGVALALSVIVFALLLEFSRALRAMRQATARPVGRVPSAVMLHTRLHAGMRLAAVLKLTRSLGRRLAEEPETFAWMDDAGDEVEVELRQGRVTAWRLRRAGGGGA